MSGRHYRITLECDEDSVDVFMRLSPSEVMALGRLSYLLEDRKKAEGQPYAPRLKITPV